MLDKWLTDGDMTDARWSEGVCRLWLSTRAATHASPTIGTAKGESGRERERERRDGDRK